MQHEKFLDTIAKRVISQNESLENTCIIVPSQRAIQYLYKALAVENKKSFFAPKIITLDAWVKECVGLPICNGMPLQFLLYKVYVAYKEKNNEVPDDFDSFFQYAEQIISDFEEIDRYLINSKAIFKNLLDIRELEAWQFDNPEQMSERQKKFLAFWNDLPFLFDALKIELKKTGVVTNAMSYKLLSEDIQLAFKENKNRSFYFVGFNAHSLSELSIIKQLKTIGRAEVWLDVDKWYLEKEIHEAGYFARKTIQHLGKDLFGVGNYLFNEMPRTIDLYESSSNTGQLAIASDLLSKIPVSKMSETLLLLGNEELISPLIRNLPKHIEKANITLGIQFKHTSLRTWVSGLFDLILLYQQRKKRFYHKDIKKLLKHPFVANSFDKKGKIECASFLMTMKKDKLIYFDLKKLLAVKHIPPLLKMVVETIDALDLNDFNKHISSFQSINQVLFDALSAAENELDKTLVVMFNERLIEMQTLFSSPLPPFSFDTFKKIVSAYLNKGGVSFYGNPLDGLQIMGLLETRLLDFENIIGVGINEDALPPNNAINSFIPMDLRAAFQLPTMRDKQALFAHHFYRLLHRSTQCHFIFGNNENSVSSAQRSRYLEQIKLELCKENPAIKLTHHLLDLETTSVVLAKSEVLKTDQILEKIKEYLHTKSFSATTLARFFNCPLDFYYTYILKFRTNDDLKETLEDSTIGTIIHKVLELGYNEQLDPNGTGHETKITTEIIEKIIKDVPNLLTKSYKLLDIGYANQENIGQNHIDLKMIESILVRYLANEKARIAQSKTPIYFVASEQEVTTMRNFDSAFGSHSIKLVGSLDRLEYENEIYSILDFKTGNLGFNAVDLLTIKKLTQKEELFKMVDVNGKDKKHPVKKDYSLQLMVYRYLYQLEYPAKITKASVIPMLTAKNSPLLSNEINNATDIVAQMDAIIGYVLNQLLDPTLPIQHNVSAKYCSFCGVKPV
jgi:ATP-dependent helicase/nuclease subunit B